MKIKKEEIKKMSKILEHITYRPIREEKASVIFFPIASDEFRDVDGMALSLTSSSEKGVKKELTPGLVLQIYHGEKRDNTYVALAYADLSYSPEFNIIQFMEFNGDRLAKKDFEKLKEYECNIVKPDYIQGMFYL